jgi:DNA-binding NarL/FixJ family response regulator
MMSSLIRIAIVYQHPIIRLALMNLLATSNEVQLVGQADELAMLLPLCQTSNPDVVLVDVGEDQALAISVIEQVHCHCPQIKIIALASSLENNIIRQVLQAGAQAYLLKNTPLRNLIPNIKSVQLGNHIFSPQILSRLVKPTPVAPHPQLTTREVEVWQLLGQGLKNREMAAHLGLRLATIKFHVANIIQKLGVADRQEAIRMAKQQQAIPASSSA